jgi:hypothetical protein
MLSIALFALAQRSPRISLTIPAARVPVVLAEISKVAGDKLAADAVMAREVVCLRVVAAPTEDVLARLAEASGGEWRVRDGVKTLVVSPEAERQDEADRERQRTKAVIAFAMSLREPPKPIVEEAFRSDMERLGAAVARAPVGKPPGPIRDEIPQPKETLLSGLIRLIPPSAYVGLRNGERIVFSSDANAMQVALPGEAQVLIDRFRYEKQLVERFADPVIHEIIAKLDPSEPPPPPSPALPESFKVLLAVQFDLQGQGEPDFSLRIIDDKGRVLDEEEKSGFDERKAQATENGPGGVNRSATAAAPIGPSEDDAEYLKWWFAHSPPYALPPGLLAKWRARLADPSKVDPLAWTASRLVRAAESQNANFVADLPDRPFIYESLMRRALTPAELWSSVSTWDKLIRRPPWIVVRPENFAENREARLDRNAAKRFYAEVAAKDGMFIDDAGEYAQSTGSRWVLGLWDYVHIRVLESLDGRNGLFWPGEVRLYGSLSPEQKHKLFAGGLRLLELDANTRELLYREFYWSQQKENFEPTEALPNGLPPSGLLHVASDSTEWAVVPVQAVPRTPDGESWAALATPYPARRFGYNLEGTGPGSTGSYQRFRLMRLRTITLQADYGPGIRRQWSLMESSYTDDPVMTFAELPQAFREAVATTRAQRQKQARDAPAPVGPPP